MINFFENRFVENLMCGFLNRYVDSENTYVSYKRNLQEFFLFIENEMNFTVSKPTDINAQQVSNYLLHLQKLVNRGVFSVQTKDAKYYCVRSFINYLNSHLDINEQIFLPKYKKSPRLNTTRVLTKNEIAKSFSFITPRTFTNAIEFKCILTLMLKYGFSHQDLSSLMRYHIDFKRHKIFVANKNCHININDEDLLDFKLAFKLCENPVIQQRFFTSKDDKGISSSKIKKDLQKLSKVVEIPDLNTRTIKCTYKKSKPIDIASKLEVAVMLNIKNIANVDLINEQEACNNVSFNTELLFA